MGLEDKHLDVLQNIEKSIIIVYEGHREMKDRHAIKALEALVDHYRSVAQGKEPTQTDLSELENMIFESVKKACDWRIEHSPRQSSAPKKRFSRAMKTEQSIEETILACLRKIHKSAKRWNRRKGERGYLDFVSDYVL